MRSTTLITCLLIIALGIANSQTAPDLEKIKAEMSKLSFMEGKWEGSGWNMGPDRQKHEFDQTEDIKFDLDGTILLIKGIGKTNGEIIHNARAIVSYDSENSIYKFRSYLSDGRTGDFDANVDGNTFTWNLNDNMRYIITISEEGKWFEKGEYKMNDQWFQFFEMSLVKK